MWKQGFSDWQKIENTELHAHFDVGMPPPLSGEHVNNGIVWVLAFAPFIGLILEWLVASMLHGSGAAYAMADGKYWFVTLVLNIALSFADEKKLSSAGYDTSKFKGWLWLVPVYLYKRAKVTKQSLAYFVVWVACFVLTLFI